MFVYRARQQRDESDRPPSFLLCISPSPVSSDPVNYHSLTVSERKKHRGLGCETGKGKIVLATMKDDRQSRKERLNTAFTVGAG